MPAERRPGEPPELRLLVRQIRAHVGVQAELGAAAYALLQSELQPPEEYEEALSPVIGCVDRAVEMFLRDTDAPVSADNLRNVLLRGIWKNVFPEVPYPVDDAIDPPRVELWKGMRSVLGVSNGMVTAPRLVPEEWPRVKALQDELMTDLRGQEKRGPKHVYRTAARFLLDLRAAVTALRNAPRPVTKKAVAGLMPREISVDSLDRTAKRFGIDLRAELGEVD